MNSTKKQAEAKRVSQHNRRDDKPCWRINGVWGNEKPRCEKLQFISHCRSCDVFEQAAREAMAGSPGVNPATSSIDDLVQQQRLSGDKSILPFRLEGFCLGIAVDKIVTIHDHIPIHSIPFNKSTVIKGVVAINHEIFSFINAAELLSLPPVDKADFKNVSKGLYKRVLVVNFNKRVMAFYVDEVYPVYRYYRQAVNENPEAISLVSFTHGRLLADSDWCSDCYILDLELLSNEFESSFL